MAHADGFEAAIDRAIACLESRRAIGTDTLAVIAHGVGEPFDVLLRRPKSGLLPSAMSEQARLFGIAYLVSLKRS